VVNDVNEAEVSSDCIGIDEVQTGGYHQSAQAIEDWKALCTFKMKVGDDQNCDNRNTRVLKKREHIGNV